jgi:hypothetical protein
MFPARTLAGVYESGVYESGVYEKFIGLLAKFILQ